MQSVSFDRPKRSSHFVFAISTILLTQNNIQQRIKLFLENYSSICYLFESRHQKFAPHSVTSLSEEIWSLVIYFVKEFINKRTERNQLPFHDFLWLP